MNSIIENIISDVHKEYNNGIDLLSTDKNKNFMRRNFSVSHSIVVYLNVDIYDEIVREIRLLDGDMSEIVGYRDKHIDSYVVDKSHVFRKSLLSLRDREMMIDTLDKAREIPLYKWEL